MKKLTSLSTGLLLIAIHAIAQAPVEKVLNTSGGSHTHGHYTFEWSVGEMAMVQTSKSSNNDYVITNGFLQPVGPKQSNNGQYFTPDEIIILPNLTHNKIEINIRTSQQGVISINIYDAGGKYLFTKKAISNGLGSIESVDLSVYSSGIYFINLDLAPSFGSIKKKGSYKVVKYN